MQTRREYHAHLLSKMNIIQQKHLALLFHNYKLVFDLIMRQRLWSVLKLEDQMMKLDRVQMVRLEKVMSFVSESSAKKLVQMGVDPMLITSHNQSDLIRFMEMKDLFENRQVPIQWGPGNHGCPELNLYKHWEKHIETDPTEQSKWSVILDDLTVESYGNYAIKSFYQMSDVIVHTNGKFVYLSGFVGSVFVVGRLDKGVFGISSAYVAETDKCGRHNGKCFVLNF